MGTEAHMKNAERLIELHGEDYFKKLGSKGGAAPHKGKRGFAAMTPEQRRAAGSKGGSRRKNELT